MADRRTALDDLTAQLAGITREELTERREAEATLRRGFAKIVRTAARKHASGSWRVGSGSAMSLHGPHGHWGQINFRLDYHSKDSLSVELIAGALSPYLMAVVNQLDPARYPPPAYVANHCFTARGVLIRYSPASADPPRSMDWTNRAPTMADQLLTEGGYTLGDETAPAWLDAVLSALVPETEALCSDLAIRDWLIDDERAAHGHYRLASPHARLAALLTKHLHRTDELEAVLARAQSLKADEDERAIAGGYYYNWDRHRLHYKQSWSHRKWLTWFDGLPA